MSAIERRLLPDTAAVSADGALSIGGVRIDDLVAEFGTPLFVYDETHLRSRCRQAIAEVIYRSGFGSKTSRTKDSSSLFAARN